MQIAVVGLGAVGTRLARQLVSSPEVDRVVLREPDAERAGAVVASLGSSAVVDDGAGDAPLVADVVVLAGPPGTHADAAAAALRRGQPVVSLAESPDEVRSLLDLDDEATERGVPVVVGAGFAPGLTDVLARHAAGRFDEVTEIHVASCGTGGPACARRHHASLGGTAVDWRDGGWVRRPAGSGRELCWFPDPIGGRDCYRAALCDALLLAPAFPGVRRVTARVAANRWDRLTARLPMLRPPHAEGGPGGVRVEVRGRRGRVTDAVVLGAMDRPAVAAGAVGALAALQVADGTIAGGGAGGLARWITDPVPFLNGLRDRGIRAAVFAGDAAPTPA